MSCDDADDQQSNRLAGGTVADPVFSGGLKSFGFSDLARMVRLSSLHADGPNHPCRPVSRLLSFSEIQSAYSSTQ
jgi:hypothetical protein